MPVCLDQWDSSFRGLATPAHCLGGTRAAAAKIILKTAVGRARGGSAVALWQGATTPWARARKAEQHRQGATALPPRVRSAFTHKVMGLMCEILSIHQVLPAELSAQLRFLG